MPSHKIYVEAVGLENFNYTLKNFNFCEYVKGKANSLKINIL